MSARVPKEIAAYLQRIADDQDRSLSWVVSYALREWVSQKLGKK